MNDTPIMSESTTVADRSNGNSRETRTYSTAVQVLQGRWFSLFASFLVMAAAGATYLFGIYSKDIKNTLGYVLLVL